MYEMITIDLPDPIPLRDSSALLLFVELGGGPKSLEELDVCRMFIAI
jgi:hypothetical protein